MYREIKRQTQSEVKPTEQGNGEELYSRTRGAQVLVLIHVLVQINGYFYSHNLVTILLRLRF